MMKTVKKVLSVFLVVLMCMTSAPLQGFVELEWPELPEFNFGEWFGGKANAIETSGSCGEDVYWNLDIETGELVISGFGAIKNYGDYFSFAPYSPFYYNSSYINSIIIENGVTSIGSAAFYKCTNVSSITIPESVTYIGKSAFLGCDNLISVNIPDSVTVISETAFSDCERLKNITVGCGVTYIGSGAFGYNFSIESVMISDVEKWCNIDFVNVYSNPLFNGSNLYLNGVLLKDLVILNGVTTIKQYAFYGCTCIENVTIPSSITSIGQSAFEYCTGLKKAYIEEIESWCRIDFANEYSNPLYYATILCLDEAIIKDLVIPDDITTINDYAFCKASSIESVTIPNSITKIGDAAFGGCLNLKSVYISDIENWCKIDFSSFASNPLSFANGNLFLNGNLVTELVIPDSITSVGNYAFDGCISLKNVTIPNSVTTIGKYAFYECADITSVNIGNKVTSIGIGAFGYCKNLKDITIPNSVITIDVNAFASCYRLKDINIPNCVTTIGNYAFENCSNIKDITIPDSVTTIGVRAFSSCRGLKCVTIGSGITNINNYAFNYCDSLTQITIPESITSIGEGAFKWCDSLLDVYYQGAEEQWKEISIGDYNECLTNATIHYNSSADEPLPELKLNFEELTISNNVCPSIYVESYPDGVTKEDIVWASSNERVAYINGSTVNPIQYGKTLITASTKDGKYSASCELTVQSSFVITSTTSSLSSIKAGEEAEFSIMLLDYEGNKLPVENVALSNESSKYLEIIKHERTETEIKLTVKGLKAGTAVLEFDNDEPLTYSKFVFDIYPATVTYRADKVPVRNEELKTNFSRAGLFVENFRYFAVGEPAEYYTALMNVYNKNSSVGIVASYTQDGKLYDIAEIKKHQAMPTDYFEFLSVLGKGAVDIALGNNYNYRYSIESTKTEIEIDVPINGYITVSNDVTSCPVTFVYGIMSVAVSTAFQLAEDLTSIEKSKESDVVKELTKKVTNYFTKDPKILDKFIKELSKKILKETTKSNITFMGEYTLDLACKIFEEIELNFEDVLKDVLLEVLKDSAHNFVSMALMKTFLSNDIIKTAEGGYIKAAEAMFTAADNINVIDEIIDFTHSAKSGITTISFGKCNEEGFVCKDVIRVNLKEEQEILDSLYLQHYQIYIGKNQLTLRPAIKDLDLKENSVIEVHEITIMRDGVPYEIKQKVSVEIDIPDNWGIFNFKIYRVEPDGKITDMFATVANGKAYFITDHFSEYIFVGELEADHTHSYTLKTIEPTHTQKGIKTFTCICGDTYTEEIEKLKEHTFGDKDEKCDCGFDRTEGCSCNCHKGGISGFFFKIILFFQKLFKSNQICKCGIKHY